MKFTLDGKVVLITGAAGGIGAACARAFHEAGAALVLTDLALAPVAALAAELGAERTLALALDVSDRAATEAVVAQAVARFGGIDLVFANAGISCGKASTIAAVDPALFETVLEVDLLGVWRTVRACLPQIIERQGHVLITASIYAFLNGMVNAPYAMSKAAVESFGRALRAELAGTGATAGVLYPGWVDTALVRPAFGGDPLATELIASAFPGPLRHAISPEQVARAVRRGVERRAARIIVPWRWAPLSLLRGLLNALTDWRLDRDRRIHALLRRLDPAVPNQAPPPSKGKPHAP